MIVQSLIYLDSLLDIYIHATVILSLGFLLSAVNVVVTQIQPSVRVPSSAQSTYSHETKSQREQQHLYGAFT